MSLKSEIQKGENKKLELKQTMVEHKKFARTIVAFANTSGGKFVIGVADDRSIIGVDSETASKLIDSLVNIISDTCSPQIRPSIYMENIDGKIVVVVEVFPGSQRPYSVNGDEVYIRISSSTRKADTETINELRRERENIGFDEEICFNYERNMENEKRFSDDFLKHAKRPLLENDLINLKLLKSVDGNLFPTNGYVLLTESVRHFDFALVKCARFKGTDMSHFIDRKELELPVYEQIEAALNFSKMYIALGCEIVGARRIDKYAIPIKAIREAVSNAVAHRSYGKNTAFITLNIFDDRVEITSPGALPGMLDVEQIKTGRSEIRNKVVARTLKEMGFIEQWGTGISRIISESAAHGVKPPLFEEIGQGFRVTIYGDIN